LVECLEGSRRAIDLASRRNDSLIEANSRYFAALALWSIGDAGGTRLNVETGIAPAERVRDRLAMANIYWGNEVLGRLTGDYQVARRFSDRGLALLPRDPRMLGTRTLLEYEVGDYEQGGRYYRRMCDTMRHATGASFEFAFVTSVTGFAAHYTGLFDRFDFDLAKRAARDVLASSTVTPLVQIRTQGGLGLIAVCERDAEEARRRYEYFLPFRGTMTPGGMGSIDHLLAIMAATMGEYGAADKHFQDAFAFCRRAGYRPEYAHLAHDYSAFLDTQGGEEGRERAMTLRHEALAIGNELGMSSLVRRLKAAGSA
jgi:hypothetical protein